MYLVTYDSGLLGVDLGKLRERYQEAEKVKIVEPKEAVERLKSAVPADSAGGLFPVGENEEIALSE